MVSDHEGTRMFLIMKVLEWFLIMKVLEWFLTMKVLENALTVHDSWPEHGVPVVWLHIATRLSFALTWGSSLDGKTIVR